MAYPTTEAYEELILEVEWTASSGTYASVCGLKDVTVSRSAEVDSDELGDCSDESLPFSKVKSVRTLEVTVTANGNWAQESHDKMMDWFRSASTKNVKIKNTAVATGEIEVESGPALLTEFNNERTKGKVVSVDIKIEFSGLPSVTDKV